MPSSISSSIMNRTSGPMKRDHLTFIEDTYDLPQDLQTAGGESFLVQPSANTPPPSEDHDTEYLTTSEDTKAMNDMNERDARRADQVRGLLAEPWDDESEKCVNGPFRYLTSHPGKDVRKKVLAAMNVWLQVDPTEMKAIAEVISLLHNASLLIDDIQDDSVLRRGAPSAHHIHGIALTINSGNYMYFVAQQKLLSLSRPSEMVQIFTEELVNLHRGQGMDIYWRDTGTVPSEDDYLKMISNKTGGLFRLATRLMMAASKTSIDLTEFADVLGLLFQIQDDYKNLTSATMSAAKGFCEDLSEGKFSYPIIHAIRNAPRGVGDNILNILKARTENNQLKGYVLSQLRDVTGSLKYTADKISSLHLHALKLLEATEARNTPMEAILAMLVVDDEKTRVPLKLNGDNKADCRQLFPVENAVGGI